MRYIETSSRRGFTNYIFYEIYIYIYIYVLLTRETKRENSLVVQWLGLGALTAEGPGLLSG